MDVENKKIQYVKKTIELKSKVEDCRIRKIASQINRSRALRNCTAPIFDIHAWLFLPSLPALSFTEMWIRLVRSTNSEILGMKKNIGLWTGKFGLHPGDQTWQRNLVNFPLTFDFLIYPLVIFPRNYGKSTHFWISKSS